MSSQNRWFQDAIYEQFARIGKALASSKRLELLNLLAQGERTVETLAKDAHLSIANTSQHLQILRTARLVEAEKKGLFVIYRLADEQVSKLLLSLQMLAESRIAEIEQIMRRFFTEKEGMEPVDRQTLLQRVREGTATVLDVRTVGEYLAGHIPGALSIPLSDLEDRLSELPSDHDIIAYCRGPYCLLAVEAVERLREKGFRAYRLDYGVQELRAEGFPLIIGKKNQKSEAFEPAQAQGV